MIAPIFNIAALYFKTAPILAFISATDTYTTV